MKRGDGGLGGRKADVARKSESRVAEGRVLGVGAEPPPACPPAVLGVGLRVWIAHGMEVSGAAARAEGRAAGHGRGVGVGAGAGSVLQQAAEGAGTGCIQRVAVRRWGSCDCAQVTEWCVVLCCGAREEGGAAVRCGRLTRGRISAKRGNRARRRAFGGRAGAAVKEVLRQRAHACSLQGHGSALFQMLKSCLYLRPAARMAMEGPAAAR